MAAESKHDAAPAPSLPGGGSSGPLSSQDHPAQEPGPLTLALQGNLNARALHEAGWRIKEARRTGRQVVLDLEEVTLMDRAGLRFLLEQRERGVELTNCPAYMTHWISRETHDPQT